MTPGVTLTLLIWVDCVVAGFHIGKYKGQEPPNRSAGTEPTSGGEIARRVVVTRLPDTDHIQLTKMRAAPTTTSTRISLPCI